jgi:hypothetical protein
MARNRPETDEELIARLEAEAAVWETQPEPTPEPLPPHPPAAATPDPWEVMARVANALEAIASRGNPSQDGQAIEKLTEALARMTDAQIATGEKQVEEQKRAFRPENKIIPNVSVFNRRGTLLEDYQKPPLKCLMMLPWLAEWESLTREEVELLNLLEAGSYIIKRADRSKITVSVDVRYKLDNITPSMLLINHETAFNNDNFKNLPPLADMLRDMLKQHDRTIAHQAAAILTDEEEEALIEAGQLSVSA